MRNFSFYILLLLLLQLTVVAVAQPQEEVVIDTVVTVPKRSPIEDGDTSSFNRIGTLLPVAIRNLPQKKLDSLKASDDFWYANLEPKKKQEASASQTAESPGLFRQKWFRNLLWIIILVSFIGVVAWYLVSGNILLFRKEAKKIHSEEIEEPTEDIFSIQFEKEIASAEGANNYRLAVRLWYLRTLKALAEKEYISYQTGRTNHDYVTQLSSGQYYNNFFRLTRNFEYTWYGQFDLSPEAYQMMRNDFSPFIKDLR